MAFKFLEKLIGKGEQEIIKEPEAPKSLFEKPVLC
jgi:hypothetical protein